MPYKLFFKPAEEKGALADVIPFFEDGTYHLFYLYDHRNPAKYGDGISWYRVCTEDFIKFDDKGMAISAGSRTDLDHCAYTGGIIKFNGLYHIFYTGHNVYIKDKDYQNECIMHAVSEDLSKWTKLPDDTFFAPEGYCAGDFRDPFVYYDSFSHSFKMLICARPREGAAIRKGELIRMTSDDLKLWNFEKKFYAPHAFHTHECPDMFRIGDWWYLIFSEYSDDYTTKYRMSHSSEGPWICPADDSFDGRAYYAAKTVSDGNDRFLFGWIPTRHENSDRLPWMWGGNLAVHKIVQHADGTLGVALPESIRNAFVKHASFPSFSLYNKYDCGEKILCERMDDCFSLSFNVHTHTGCNRFGITLNKSQSDDKSFAFVFDMNNRTVEVGTRPAFPAGEYDNYHMSRPLPEGNTFDVTLIADNDIYVIYIGGEIALSSRCCNTPGKEIGIFSEFSDIDVENITISTLP